MSTRPPRPCTRGLLLAVGLLLGLACESVPGEPTIAAVSPRQAPDDVSTELLVTGGGFRQRVVTDFTHKGSSMLDERYTLKLGEATLQEPRRVSDEELRAVVPAGLAPGLYALTVEDPYGRSVTLADAFRVVASGLAAGLSFTNAPTTVEAGSCSPALAVQTVDGVGRPAAVAAATTINLTGDLQGVQFFDDAACANAVSAVTIAAGRLSAGFHFRSSTAGALRLTAVAVGLTPGTQTQTVLPAAAAAIAFATPPRSVEVGACSAAVTVELRDSLGNAATAASAVTLAFGAVPIGGVLFFSDPACTTAASSATLAVGESRATRYLQGGAPGTVTINVSATGFNAISQQATVDAVDAGTGGGGATGGGGGATGGGGGTTGGGGGTTGGGGGATGGGGGATGGGGGTTGGGGGTTGGGGGTTGLPPQARLVVSPTAVDLSATITADATGSTDAEDLPAALEARFDYESDGTWDTTFSAARTATFSFATAGLRRVTVEVRDTGGQSAFAEASVFVRAASDAVVVTTAADEADSGATPASPGGTGLSLREAIAFTNGRAGHDVISFSGPMTITVGSSLPAITDSQGTTIMGRPGVILDGTGAPNATTGLTLSGLGARVVGLEIARMPKLGVRIDGANAELRQCFIHDGGDIGVQVLAAGVIVHDTEISTHPGETLQLNGVATVTNCRLHHGFLGIAFYAGSNGSVARGNRLWSNTLRGASVATNVANLVIWHNVFFGNAQAGLWLTSTSTGADIRNNIFMANGTYGVETTASLGVLDGNDCFGNTAGAYNGPTPGPASKTVDPLFVAAGSNDYRLQPTSPLINAGLITTADVNGPAAGLFNGSAPDIGAHETP